MMRTRHVILATVAVAALAVPAALLAAGHMGGPMGFGMHGGPAMMEGGGVLRLAHKLGLSDDQTAQIKSILAAARAANAPVRTQLRANRQAFNSAYNPAQFDATAVNSYLAQQTPLVQQLVVSSFQTRAKVLAVLTPSQLAQLNQLRAQFKQWRASDPMRP